VRRLFSHRDQVYKGPRCLSVFFPTELAGIQLQDFHPSGRLVRFPAEVRGSHRVRPGQLHQRPEGQGPDSGGGPQAQDPAQPQIQQQDQDPFGGGSQDQELGKLSHRCYHTITSSLLGSMDLNYLKEVTRVS